jgi:ketopantoate reductase
VSFIGAEETEKGTIVQGDRDRLKIGAFGTDATSEEAENKARDFVTIYGAAGKTQVLYSPDVLTDRWRKLVYNACLNPICAITGLDTGRIRLAGRAGRAGGSSGSSGAGGSSGSSGDENGGNESTVEALVKPAMREIVSAARACGVVLEEGVVQEMVDMDPLTLYLKPSMLGDVEKVCHISLSLCIPAYPSLTFLLLFCVCFGFGVLVGNANKVG